MNQMIQIIQEDACRIVNAIDYNWLNNKRVLVTGGTGVLGTYFLACLQEIKSRGCHVTVTYTARSGSTDPRYFPALTEGMDMRNINLTQPDELEDLPFFDCIIHAAGYGQPARFMANPLDTIAINTQTLIGLCSCLLPNGKSLFISSSEVYSGNPYYPHTEKMIGLTTPDHPRAAYIEAKRCGEAICHALCNQGECYRIARVSLSYGPGTNKIDQRVLNDFMRKAIVDGKIVMKDPGMAWRTYCYVADNVELLFNVLLHGKERVYNVGGISQTTIRSLASRIADIADVPMEAPEIPNVDDNLNPPDRQAAEGAPDIVQMDISKVCGEFNKSKDSFIGLREGLERTYRWQKDLYA